MYEHVVKEIEDQFNFYFEKLDYLTDIVTRLQKRYGNSEQIEIEGVMCNPMKYMLVEIDDIKQGFEKIRKLITQI